MAEMRPSSIIPPPSPKRLKLLEIIEKDRIGEIHNYSIRKLLTCKFEGKKTLQIAAEKGSVIILDYLLRLDFNEAGESKTEYLNSKGANGISVVDAIIANNKLLEDAARMGHVSIVERYPVEKLLEYSSAEGGNIFHLLALNNSSYEPLVYILEKKEFAQSYSLREQEDKYKRTPLLCAITVGNISFIQEFLRGTKLSNSVNSMGLTPLSFAIKNKSLKVVKVLHECGASIDALDREGNTTLAQAVLADSLELVTYFLDCMIGSRKPLLQKDFINTLRWAALGNHYDICQTLISLNIHRNFPDRKNCLDILFVLIKLGLLEEVKYFFCQRLIFELPKKDKALFKGTIYQRLIFRSLPKTDGVSAEIGNILSRMDSVLFKDRTIFDIVVENGTIEMIVWLFTSRFAAVVKKNDIEEKIRVGVYATDYMSQFLARIYSEINARAIHAALDIFFKYKNINVFKKDMTSLLSSGEYIDARDEKYDTVLMRLAATPHSELLDFLLKNKASSDNENAEGRLALHIAVAAAQLENVELLIAHNINNLLHMDGDGNTPLHIAAKSNNLQMINLLVKYNFRALRIENFDGEIPLHIAAASGHYDVVNKLLELDADSALSRNNKGELLLHKAARQFTQNFPTFMSLVNHNNEALNIPDIEGNTPFYFYMESWLLHSYKLWIEKELYKDESVVKRNNFIFGQRDNFLSLLSMGANSDFKNLENESPEILLINFMKEIKENFFRKEIFGGNYNKYKNGNWQREEDNKAELKKKAGEFLLPYKVILLEFRINKFNKLIAEFNNIGIMMSNYINHSVDLRLFVYYSTEIDYKVLAKELVSAIGSKKDAAEIHKAVRELVDSLLSKNPAVKERITRWYARYEGIRPDMLSRLLVEEPSQELSGSSPAVPI